MLIIICDWTSHAMYALLLLLFQIRPPTSIVRCTFCNSSATTMVQISKRVQQGECTKHFLCILYIHQNIKVKIEEPYSWISASVNSVLCLRSSRTSGFNLLFCLPIYMFLKLKIKIIVIIVDFFYVSPQKQNNLSALQQFDLHWAAKL